ncbi:outer membrane beta-barrel protein [Bacteroidota bacterium]
MYPIKSFLCYALLLLFVVSANAQDDRTRLGFGVGVGISTVPMGDGDDMDLSSLSAPVSFHNFTFIIRGKSFRIEPNFGFFSYSQETDAEDENEDTYKEEISSSNFRVGAVLAYATAIGSTNLYYGLNIGIISSSASIDQKWTGTYTPDNTSEKGSKTDFAIGGAIGGEYMFSDNFSLGGEIQINYITVGQFDWELPEHITKNDITTSIISTNAIVMLRWYVN